MKAILNKVKDNQESNKNSLLLMRRHNRILIPSIFNITFYSCFIYQELYILKYIWIANDNIKILDNLINSLNK